MYPKAEKMTNPARRLVRELTMAMVRVSLWGGGVRLGSADHTTAHSSSWSFSLQVLLQHVVVEGVVAGHGHERAEAYSDGVEDLRRSVHPHLEVSGGSVYTSFFTVTH